MKLYELIEWFDQHYFNDLSRIKVIDDMEPSINDKSRITAVRYNQYHIDFQTETTTNLVYDDCLFEKLKQLYKTYPYCYITVDDFECAFGDISSHENIFRLIKKNKDKAIIMG